VEQGFAAVPGVRNTGLVAYAVTVTVARFQGSSREHTASDLRCYRTCVIDGLLEHSPAEHVRRPAVPAESPTLGFTHLQFEALLSAARESHILAISRSCPRETPRHCR
jgi:hypothetical protein